MTMRRLPTGHGECAICGTTKCVALGVGTSVLAEGAEGAGASVQLVLVLTFALVLLTCRTKVFHMGRLW